MVARRPAQISKLAPRLPAVPSRSSSFRPVNVLSPLDSAPTKIVCLSTKADALTASDSVLTDIPSGNPFVIRCYENTGAGGMFRLRCSRAGHESQVTSFHSLAASLSSLCALFCTRSLSFQWFAASFPKTPGWGVSPPHPRPSDLPTFRRLDLPAFRQ